MQNLAWQVWVAVAALFCVLCAGCAANSPAGGRPIEEGLSIEGLLFESAASPEEACQELLRIASRNRADQDVAKYLADIDINVYADELRTMRASFFFGLGLFVEACADLQDGWDSVDMFRIFYWRDSMSLEFTYLLEEEDNRSEFCGDRDVDIAIRHQSPGWRELLLSSYNLYPLPDEDFDYSVPGDSVESSSMRSIAFEIAFNSYLCDPKWDGPESSEAFPEPYQAMLALLEKEIRNSD